MSWTVANRAFHCTIISFKIRLHQLGYAVLINKAHKCQTLTRGRNNQIFNYSSNNNTKITKETLLLLLRWEYKYFFFVSVVYAIASDRFFDFFLFSLPRIICCFPKPMPLKYMYRSSCCAVRNVIYPYFWFDRSLVHSVSMFYLLLFSSNFLFFLFVCPFLFNFVEPSSAKKYQPSNEWMNQKKYLQRLLSIVLAVKSWCLNFFSLISENKVLISVLCSIGCCFCVHFSLHCCY